MGLCIDERTAGLHRAEGRRENRSPQVQLLHVRVRLGPREARAQDRVQREYHSHLSTRK